MNDKLCDFVLIWDLTHATEAHAVIKTKPWYNVKKNIILMQPNANDFFQISNVYEHKKMVKMLNRSITVFSPMVSVFSGEWFRLIL